jgi:hypothetical protein
MKTLHKISTNKKNLDEKFFVFDTETRGLRAKRDAFIFGVVYGLDYTCVIHSVDEFIQEFEKPMYKGKTVFAHNAEYDLNVLFDNIYLFDNRAIFNGKFISATNGNCLFADSLNIYPASVDKIGELMGFPKLKLARKFKEGDKKIKVTKKDIEYCVRDCEIVFNALSSIFNKVGNIKITLAGLSMDFFRRRYLKYHIDFNPKLTDKFFDSYFGGRTEAFKIGDTKAVVYDINSMYPYAMLNADFPNPKLLKHISRKFIDVGLFKRHFLRTYEGCAKITVIHKEHYFGFLPIKQKGKLIFPVGEFTGTWNFNEIRYALEQGIIEIKKVWTVTYSRRMESPFIKYVTALYGERKISDNELDRLQLKLLLNSLYGKFGQKKKTEFIYIEDVKRDYLIIDEFKNSGELIKIRTFNLERDDCFLEVVNKKQEKYYNSIALFASYITSFARVMLLKDLVNNKNFVPVYCDTDSIFYEVDPKIKEGKELGEWKKENKLVYNIRGLKNYSYFADGKKIDKIKGIPKKARKISDKKYTYENLVKTREAITRNIEAGVLVTRTKELKNTYDKRIILKNNDTLPLKLTT